MSDRRKSEGLYGKFRVTRTDGRDAAGEKHEGCTYFVLDLQHDKHMPPALRAYADSCEKEYPVLASQLRIVADDFGQHGEFIGIMAQKPALDLARQESAPAASPAPVSAWQPNAEEVEFLIYAVQRAPAFGHELRAKQDAMVDKLKGLLPAPPVPSDKETR